MSAMASKPRKASRIDAEITACTMLTRYGDPCGKPGNLGLPAGVCPECAVRVFRAVSRLVEIQAQQEGRVDG